MATDRDAVLVQHEPLEGGYFTLTFEHPEVAGSARAGHFVMIKAGVSSAPPLRRPFSILGVDPPRGTFSLFLKAVGAGSRSLAEMRPGELAQCLGPLGRPFAPAPDGAEAVLVAGGYGIAPMLLFGHELAAQGRRARLFYGGRSARDLQLQEPFAALDIPLVAATEDGSQGERGFVTLPLEAYLDSRRGPLQIYACGPDAMLHAVARIAAGRSLPAQLSLDPWMGCGVGTCLGCVVRIQRADEERPKYRCACTEGPVFDASDVVWRGDRASAARLRALEVGR